MRYNYDARITGLAAIYKNTYNYNAYFKKLQNKVIAGFSVVIMMNKLVHPSV